VLPVRDRFTSFFEAIHNSITICPKNAAVAATFLKTDWWRSKTD
jgi:hypothetical protein